MNLPEHIDIYLLNDGRMGIGAAPPIGPHKESAKYQRTMAADEDVLSMPNGAFFERVLKELMCGEFTFQGTQGDGLYLLIFEGKKYRAPTISGLFTQFLRNRLPSNKGAADERGM